MLKHITIDLGTSNTVISSKDKGVLLNEPSVAALDLRTNNIVAVGSDAKNLLDKTPKDIGVVLPLKNSVISDFDVAVAMVKSFLTSIFPKTVIRPKATLIMPQGITNLESKAAVEVVSRSGAKVSYTIESPIAAALGMNLDIAKASGNMLLDIGGGKASATVVSFGGIVTSFDDDCSGNEMDNLIVSYIKENLGAIIGKTTAESIKMSIGTGDETHDEEITVMGRDEKTGLPKEIKISGADVYESISPVLSKIVKLIKTTLTHTPAELMRDIHEQGIFLLGGVSQMRGLDKFIEKSIGIKTHICKNPKECVSLGACYVFDAGVVQ